MRDKLRAWRACTTKTMPTPISNAATPSDNSGGYTAIKSPTAIIMMPVNMVVLLISYGDRLGRFKTREFLLFRVFMR